MKYHIGDIVEVTTYKNSRSDKLYVKRYDIEDMKPGSIDSVDVEILGVGKDEFSGYIIDVTNTGCFYYRFTEWNKDWANNWLQNCYNLHPLNVDFRKRIISIPEKHINRLVASVVRE